MCCVLTLSFVQSSSWPGCAAKLTDFAGVKAKLFRLDFAWNPPKGKKAKLKPYDILGLPQRIMASVSAHFDRFYALSLLLPGM